MIETHAFPDDPNLLLTANFLERGEQATATNPNAPTPAATFLANFAGTAMTDPIVGMAHHLHDYPGTVQGPAFTDPPIDSAVPIDANTFRSVTIHEGEPNGYMPQPWWPHLLGPDGQPVVYKQDLALYHVYWDAGLELVAPPSGTRYIIRHGINGTIQHPQDPWRINVLGPKGWDGRQDSDDHVSHTSKTVDAAHPIPIAQVQMYLRFDTPGPYRYVEDGVETLLDHADYAYAYREGLLGWLYSLCINRPASEGGPRKAEAIRFESLTPDPPEPPPDDGRERALAEIAIAEDALTRAREHLQA